MKRLLLLCLSLVACRREAPAPAANADAGTPQVVASASAAVSAAASAASPASAAGSAMAPLDATRTKGAVRGGFALDRLQYSAGSPMVVTFFANNTGTAPLKFDVGGDAGSVLMPLRYGLVVKDAQGAEVCNLRKAQPTGVGGLKAATDLAPKARYRERFMLNGACEAFTKPGKYTATLVRRLSAAGAEGACNDLLPDEAVAADASPACKASLEAAPTIATDLSFEIVAYDAKALAASLQPLVTEAKDAKDLDAAPERYQYFQWLCRRVTCGCKLPKAGPELSPFMADIAAKLPAAIPDKCP